MRHEAAVGSRVTGPVRRLLVAGTGHAPDAPDAVTAAVAGFLEQVRRPGHQPSGRSSR